MNDRYAQWISGKLAVDNPTHKCAEWTSEMQADFPELRRVRGTVMLSLGYEREHWWLVDADGEVIDPTVSQYTDKGGYYGGCAVLLYTPRDESQPEPIGKCHNCGEYSYTSEYGGLCSSECEQSYRAYLMEAIRL